MIVAIDGPAGSGKSTISKLLAKRLGFLYLDTGAMYRALTLKVIGTNVDPGDEQRVIELASKLEVRLQGERVFLDGVDVSGEVRTPEVEKIISAICKIPKVRQCLVGLQRNIAAGSSVVVEGRDITTVVFPQAEVKVFLDASVDERTRRRERDFKDQGFGLDREIVKDELAKRDRADCSRAVSPLKKSPDAVIVDTTDLNIEQVVDKIYSLVKQKR